MFVQAKQDEIDSVWRIYADAVPHQNQIGIDHWDINYPAKDVIINDIAEQKCFVVHVNNVPAAVFRIDSEQHPSYQDINWQYGKPYICVHRLCVHPDAQGKGLAKGIMRLVISKYKHEGYKAIRLDTYMGNWIALRLYEGLGFERRGIVHLHKDKNRCYMCLEFKL